MPQMPISGQCPNFNAETLNKTMYSIFVDVVRSRNLQQLLALLTNVSPESSAGLIFYDPLLRSVRWLIVNEVQNYEILTRLLVLLRKRWKWWNGFRLRLFIELVFLADPNLPSHTATSKARTFWSRTIWQLASPTSDSPSSSLPENAPEKATGRCVREVWKEAEGVSC